MKQIVINGIKYNYQIDKNANIYSGFTKKIMKSTSNGKGYQIISLWHNGKGNIYYIHRLMGFIFLDLKKDKQINHIDNNKKNNKVDNLEVVNALENYNHSLKFRNKNTKRKLSTSDAIDIFRSKQSYRNLSNKYNVSIDTIYRIKNKKSYKWIFD